MGTISVSLPSDGETADVADYNTPITTIVNEINGGLDNANIASDAAIDGSKLADDSVPVSKLDFTTFGSFSAGRAAAQNITSSGNVVAFDTEDYDVGGGFSDSTGVFTVPSGMAGIWRFAACIHITGLSSQVVAIDFRKNSTAVFRICRVEGVTGGWSLNGACEISLAEGDTVDVFAVVTGTTRSTTGGAAQNFFIGSQVTKA